MLRKYRLWLVLLKCHRESGIHTDQCIPSETAISNKFGKAFCFNCIYDALLIQALSHWLSPCVCQLLHGTTCRSAYCRRCRALPQMKVALVHRVLIALQHAAETICLGVSIPRSAYHSREYVFPLVAQRKRRSCIGEVSNFNCYVHDRNHEQDITYQAVCL